jgi:hypothetical protein
VELGPLVILILKIAVSTVTLLLAASLVALLRGNYRLHGRINLVFFALTLTALIALEALVKFRPKDFEYIQKDPWLTIHLCFSVPSAILMGAMLYTGLKHRPSWHISLAVLFGICWTGTFITGIFFLH